MATQGVHVAYGSLAETSVISTYLVVNAFVEQDA
jgi:hypothetical protein